MRGPLAGVIGTLVTIIGFALSVTTTRSKPTQAYIQPEAHTAEYQTALFEASRVYGKAGCGNMQLAEMTAEHAIRSGLPAQLIAAQIATESTCNPLAVSNRGAIGLRQVVPKIWAKTYDFSKINLFNPSDNMAVADNITVELVKKYGIRGGLIHYYGTGNDGIGQSGAVYAERVLKLAGKI